MLNEVVVSEVNDERPEVERTWKEIMGARTTDSFSHVRLSPCVSGPLVIFFSTILFRLILLCPFEISRAFASLALSLTGLLHIDTISSRAAGCLQPTAPSRQIAESDILTVGFPYSFSDTLVPFIHPLRYVCLPGTPGWLARRPRSR